MRVLSDGVLRGRPWGTVHANEDALTSFVVVSVGGDYGVYAEVSIRRSSPRRMRGRKDMREMDSEWVRGRSKKSLRTEKVLQLFEKPLRMTRRPASRARRRRCFHQTDQSLVAVVGQPDTTLVARGRRSQGLFEESSRRHSN